VHGNIFEWLEDCWHKNYEGAPIDGAAWIFALRRQTEAATDTMEKPYAEIDLQRKNLPRCRRLAEIQTRSSAGDAAGIGDVNEGAQMAPTDVIARLITQKLSEHLVKLESLFANFRRGFTGGDRTYMLHGESNRRSSGASELGCRRMQRWQWG
jgi:hypothetical protein